jgi:tripartite-type tricarboxylate transporter receptor subunit TctC
VHGGVAWRRLSRRPITMVVPFPPGPALDLVARLVTASGVTLGQTVVTEPAPAPTA